MSSRDSLDIYFEQIRKYPLLTKEQEVSLHKRLSAGCESSRELFINSNLRWVITIAKKNTGRGLDLEDLVQHGNFGLLTAVEKFKPALGYKFSTYSAWWIRQAITRAVNDYSRTIRFPVHAAQFVAKIMKTISELKQELQKENITDKDIIDNTEFTAVDIKRLTEMGSSLICDPKLDLEDDSDGIEFLETVSYDGVETPESKIDDESQSDTVEKLLSFVSDRDRRILAQRFELFGSEKLTLEEIGDIEEVSRERIRQLEGLALKRMRRKAETHNMSWR